MEIGEQGVAVNLCAAVKVTGGPDTEGPLRRLCGELDKGQLRPVPTVVDRVSVTTAVSHDGFSFFPIGL